MRRIPHIFVITVVAVLSVGEAYHFHPDGGAHWHFVAFPVGPSPVAPDGSHREGETPSNGPTVCPLHFWASVFSTLTILLALLLLAPNPAVRLHQFIPLNPPSWSGFALAIRGPPLVLA
jgi:hypothetical protein